MPTKDPVKVQEKVTPKDPELEVVQEEHKPEEVEVNLSTPKQEDPAPDSTEKLRNQMFYEQRQLEKRIMAAQKQMMEEFYQRVTGPQAQAEKASEKLDEFDEEVERIAQTDWRKAVDMRAERIAEKKLEEKLRAQEEARKQEDTRQTALRIEARGREKVLAEFPDIMDESTPEFKVYMELYNKEISEDPMFMYNPRKHELILPELREKMGSRKVDANNPEIERLKRVAAGSSTPSRPSSNSNKIMLTQDEISMCKRSGIPIETYARTKSLGQAGLKEGMVLDE